MPVVTGATLLQRVRDQVDAPSEGDGSRAYITDTMIYSWLSKSYRKALRSMVRAGYPIAKTTEAFANPGASVTLSSAALAILSVRVLKNDSLYPLPMLREGDELNVSGSAAHCWQPAISNAGSFTLNLYPNESTGTVKVYYLAEPAELTGVSSVYLPSEWEDVCVYEACMRALARKNERNDGIAALLGEAMLEAEAAAAHYTANNVIKNTDDVYPPGYDQGRTIDGLYTFDPYLVP